MQETFPTRRCPTVNKKSLTSHKENIILYGNIEQILMYNGTVWGVI